MNTPHKHRRSAVHLFIIIPIVFMFIVIWLSSCSRYGCPATSGKNYKVGYGFLKASGMGWVRCPQTGLVSIMDKQTGKIIAQYYTIPSRPIDNW